MGIHPRTLMGKVNIAGRASPPIPGSCGTQRPSFPSAVSLNGGYSRHEARSRIRSQTEPRRWHLSMP